jgi:hypothetical protein
MDTAEVVVTNITTGLTDEDIAFGKKLWHELGTEGSPFPVRGMFWLLEGEWHLVVASEVAEKLGPRDAYRELDKVVHVPPTESSELSKIDLISPKSPLYEAFRALWTNTPPERVEGRRLSNSQVAGMYIEDVYFYGVR